MKIIDNTKQYFVANKQLGVAGYFADWTTWEKWWGIIATLAIGIASILTWDVTNQLASWLAIISGITGIWCVLLVAKKRISNYIFGLVNVIAYAWAAYLWHIYGDFMLNAFYFLPMQFVGWYYWTKPKVMDGVDKVAVKKLTWQTSLLTIVGAGIAVFGYKFVLTAMGGNTPLLDATSTVFSVIAMIYMLMRLREQWILWIIVNVATVLIWLFICFRVEGGMVNFGMLIMWLAWTINSGYGYFNWKD